MNQSLNRNGYLKRFAVSFGIVGGSLLPALIQFGPMVAFVSSWCWLVMLHDAFNLFPGLELHPVILALGSLCIVAAAATRQVASIIATVWLALNAIGLWFVLATFRLEPAG